MSNLASTKNQREYILLDTWFSLDVVGVFLRETSIWLAFNVTISTNFPTAAASSVGPRPDLARRRPAAPRSGGEEAEHA